jgi:hypothetical protein
MQPAPQAGLLERRQVAQGAEPVESEETKAHVEPVEPGQGREEAQDRDEDGRIAHDSLHQDAIT